MNNSEDLSKELKKIIKSFDKELTTNPKIIELLKSKKNYDDVNEYSIILGEILSEVFNQHITKELKDYFPEIINNRLKNNHNLITDYAFQVQTLLNQKANVNLDVLTPIVNQNRIDGIVNKLMENDFDKVKWMLGAPIVTFSQSIVDETIEKNAKFHYDSGLTPKIIRKESGNCCDWCRNLVGTYKYPDVPKDVYRRHNRCRCTVDYISKDGKTRQNVHTKKEKPNIIDEKQDLPYKSVKSEWLKNYKEPKVTELNYFEHEGVKYFVNGKDVIFTPSSREKEVANLIADKFGVHVTLLPRVLEPDFIKTPDYLINGSKFDLKEIEGLSVNTFDNAIKKKKEQAHNFIFDISKINIDIEDCFNRVRKLYFNKSRSWLKTTMIIKDEDILDIIDRK